MCHAAWLSEPAPPQKVSIKQATRSIARQGRQGLWTNVLAELEILRRSGLLLDAVASNACVGGLAEGGSSLKGVSSCPCGATLAARKTAVPTWLLTWRGAQSASSTVERKLQVQDHYTVVVGSGPQSTRLNISVVAGSNVAILRQAIAESLQELDGTKYFNLSNDPGRVQVAVHAAMWLHSPWPLIHVSAIIWCMLPFVKMAGLT
eukprot:s398_g20.t1